PSPAYPRLAIQRGLEGVVLLRILVGTDGRPLEVGIEQSSGHAVLDREALRHVQRNWTFRPALRDGQPVQAVGIVPIEFRLGRGEGRVGRTGPAARRAQTTPLAPRPVGYGPGRARGCGGDRG